MASTNEFVGIWSTSVPGTYVNSEFRPGASGGDLFIQADGTYVWYSSYGPNGVKTGTWGESSISGYAIALHDPFENYDWNIGFKTEPSSIYLFPVKPNGTPAGFYYSGNFVAPLPGTAQSNSSEGDASGENEQSDDSLSGFEAFEGLIYAFSLEEYQGGLGDYDIKPLDWDNFIRPLTGLAVGESAAILVAGTFASNNSRDTYTLGLLSSLTAAQLRLLEENFILAVSTTPGSNFSDATNNATRAVLPYGSPYAREGFTGYYFGLSGGIGANPSITVHQINTAVNTYGLMLTFYRISGVKDTSAPTGIWTPIPHEGSGDFELISFSPGDDSLGLDISQVGISL